MNRRKLLASGAAALPLAVAGVSTVESAPVPEYPMETMTRLAKPFVKALQDWHADLGTGDAWLAEIHPEGRFSLVSIEAMAGNRRPSPIAALYDQWVASMAATTYDMGDAEIEVRCAESRRLQDAILQATPRTPRDVALQVWCDMDQGDSDFSKPFLERLCALAGVERRKEDWS